MKTKSSLSSSQSCKWDVHVPWKGFLRIADIQPPRVVCSPEDVELDLHWNNQLWFYKRKIVLIFNYQMWVPGYLLANLVGHNPEAGLMKLKRFLTIYLFKFSFLTMFNTVDAYFIGILITCTSHYCRLWFGPNLRCMYFLLINSLEGLQLKIKLEYCENCSFCFVLYVMLFAKLFLCFLSLEDL